MLLLLTMLTHIGGVRDGQEWPPVGGQIDVGDVEAADLILAGYAKEAATDEAATDPTEAPTGDDGEAAPSEDGGTITGTQSVRPAKRPRKRA